MKNFKWLLAGFIVLVILVLLGVFAWLLSSNQANSNPLPILHDDSMPISAEVNEDMDTQAPTILYLQAAASMQLPLDEIIMRFESRYPKVQILTRYVTTTALLNLPNASDIKNSDAKNQVSPLITTTDLLIANEKLSQGQLSTLQSILNQTQNNNAQKRVIINADHAKDKLQETINISSNNNSSNAVTNVPNIANNVTSNSINNSSEVRNLVSFSYALKDQQYLDGVILTNNLTAVTFRNFLLSSTGQDILKQYDYDNIDGYKSSVDDMFNPSSRDKATDEISSKITEALSNGKWLLF